MDECHAAAAEALPTGLWLGLVVPKRHARRSVTRSLLKRHMRTLMQQHAPDLAPGLWVLRLKAPFDRQLFGSAASTPLRQAARSELEALRPAPPVLAPAPELAALPMVDGAQMQQTRELEGRVAGLSAMQLATKGGHTFVPVSAEQITKWRTAVAPLYDKWVTDADKAGINGRQALQALRDELKKTGGAY